MFRSQVGLPSAALKHSVILKMKNYILLARDVYNAALFYIDS
jgi:hypothetical protein